MAGQLIRRGDRTWLVRVYLGRDADSGKRRYYNKTIQGSKKDAQRYLTEKLSERDTGTFVQPATESVTSYLERWIESSARGRVRPVTLESYHSLLRNYIVPTLGGRRLGQLGPVEIQKLYTDMQRRGLSAKTVRYTHTVLRQALEQAVKWRLLSHNPATLVSLPRQRRKEMRALDPEETRRFLEAAAGDRWSAIWMLLVTTRATPWGGTRPEVVRLGREPAQDSKDVGTLETREGLASGGAQDAQEQEVRHVAGDSCSRTSSPSGAPGRGETPGRLRI